jgi:symplekin
MSRKADNDSNIDDDPPMDLDDDNNEQADLDGNEDPFVMAVDDLEGRVITAINALKTHPGVHSTDARNIHDELQAILRPVLEVAAHTAPSVARTYYRGEQGVEAGVEQAYEKIISDLVLPVLLESAQSDPIPVKRGTCLEFYRILWKECHKPGSWIDTTTTGPNAGPYGAGGATAPFANTPAGRATLKRRQQKTQNREGEILRYWVESASACLVEGVFTAEESDVAAVCRIILAASGVLRPALAHISQRIRDADDRGAVKLFNPVMRMVGGVLKKLFLGTNDEVRSTCLKFLEIVVLCCSHKPEDPHAGARRRGPNVSACIQWYRWRLTFIIHS